VIRGLFVALLLAISAVSHGTSVPQEHVRTPDQTFLTFPEWYLVHSPAEYAAYLERGASPSAFPLFAHIGQFWQSYAAVNREIAEYPFNGGYHLMVMVIGVSTTVEYSLKGLYERTVGRLAEALASAPVPEEQFAARFAQSYVDFIRVEPWYQFNFWSTLTDLWSSVPLHGPDLIRRWERRFLLTSELLVKAGYGQLIRVCSESVYDVAKPVTAVRVNRVPVPDQSYPDFKLLDSSGLATIPRYEAFSRYSLWLASQGIDFIAVAGNDGEIVISLIVPDAWTTILSRQLFEQPVLTRPGTKRSVLAIPVRQLGDFLRHVLTRPEIVVEHIYDF